ncbi:hypothetical protein KSP39_PZI001701 [Platanthera zijinensis]|uniref:Uncharacterized protein n=1 Tax=Platanthera zijinensis TaxID=2320716 RepID=A0AAP0BYW1_9ASPA
MARSLSQTLIRESRVVVRDLSLSGIISRPPPLKLIGVRLRSGRPEAGQLVEVDLGAVADGSTVEVEVLSIRRLEEAIQSYVIKKAAPGWLPFAPGASYWVPPGSQGLGEVDLVDRPDNPLTEEFRRRRTSGREWPSSSFFFDGGMPELSSKLSIRDMTAAQSDDED